jgi:HAD superfamily hydrolase (TIGR01509 family)
MAKIKAVIFDMDGVLIDAKEWHYHALNKALQDFDCPVITREQHVTTFDGLPTKQKLTVLYDIHQKPVPALHDKINKLKQSYTIEHAMTSCKPLNIHCEALCRLKAEGYRLVCCSNSIRKTVNLLLNLADIHKYLEFFLSNQDVQNPKPSPEIYLKAIARLGLAPQEILICEDNGYGLESAEAAGAHILKIDTVFDVNYENIKQKITAIEKVPALSSLTGYYPPPGQTSANTRAAKGSSSLYKNSCVKAKVKQHAG